MGRLPGNYATRAPPSSTVTTKTGRGGRVGGGSRKEAELVLCVDGNDGKCVGCAGIEISKTKKMDGYDTAFLGPVMSNLAVDREEYRRRGLAKRLVEYVEDLAQNEWGYNATDDVRSVDGHLRGQGFTPLPVMGDMCERGGRNVGGA